MKTLKEKDLKTVKNEKIKKNILWSNEEILNNEKNIIVFARNASGKTTLSNFLSGEKTHYHREYVRLDSDSEEPNLLIGNKVRKFTYNERKIYHNLLKNNTKFRENIEIINSKLNKYIGSATVGDHKFLKSLNNDLIDISLKKFDLELCKWVENEIYVQENYYSRPYIHLNISPHTSNFKNITKKTILNKGKFKGDGEYIKMLLDESKTAEAKNGIYLLIILISKFPKEINILIKNKLNLILNDSLSWIPQISFDSDKLLKIKNELVKNNIINKNTLIEHEDNNVIKLIENEKNVTMNIYSVISNAQEDLISMIFFNVLNEEEDIIIIDDPFDSFDYQNAYEMIKIIKRREKNKRTIILFHSASHLSLMKQYVNKHENWKILYMSLHMHTTLKDLKENPISKFRYIYSNNSKFKRGIFLLLRHITNENSFNKFIYFEKEFNKDFSKLFLNEIFKEREIEPENISFYSEVLLLFDKLVDIKRWFKKHERYDQLKNQFKKGIYSGDDETMNLYSNIYFIFNDLSHNNKWGLDIFDIISYKEEIDCLHKLAISKITHLNK